MKKEEENSTSAQSFFSTFSPSKLTFMTYSIHDKIDEDSIARVGRLEKEGSRRVLGKKSCR